jgi:hypothetical protein
MAINKYTIRWMYVYDFKTTVAYFAKTLKKKVLPAFEDISAEADEVEEEAFERLGRSVDPEWYDPADCADAAHDAGISFYIMADGMRQGITNLFAAGLYHLFEQWFLKFHRRELLSYREEGNLSLLSWGEAKKRLLENYGINVEGFASWPKVSELRLLANTVKHADGLSCQELKCLRPDLFVSPRLEKDGYAIDLMNVRRCFSLLSEKTSMSVSRNLSNTWRWSSSIGTNWRMRVMSLSSVCWPRLQLRCPSSPGQLISTPFPSVRRT